MPGSTCVSNRLRRPRTDPTGPWRFQNSGGINIPVLGKILWSVEKMAPLTHAFRLHLIHKGIESQIISESTKCEICGSTPPKSS